MKIAIVTNDSRSISAHFGRARRYLVLTVEQGAVVAREEREKPAHSHSHHHHDHDSTTGTTTISTTGTTTISTTGMTTNHWA